MKTDIDLDKYGGHAIFRWDHDYLVKVLTTGKEPIVKSLYLRNAIRSIRRDDFVPASLQDSAFEDKDIDIGYGEKLDKPSVIAFMLEQLKPKLGEKFLDIGTGSGWVAALLGYAAGVEGKVYSIERVQFIAQIARNNLNKYPKINNIAVLFADGSKGLPEYSPYDGIHIAAAFNKVPAVITNQLKVGGRLVAPTVNNDVRLIERVAADQFEETVFPGYFFKLIEGGIV